MIFSKKYNKDAEFFKSKYLSTEEALSDIIFKIVESGESNLMMSKFFLLTLICSDSRQNKMLLSRKFDVATFLNAYDVGKMTAEQQQELLIYTLELCLKKGQSNQQFNFEPDLTVKKYFSSTETQEIENLIYSIEQVSHSYIPNFGEDVIEDFQSISQV